MASNKKPKRSGDITPHRQSNPGPLRQTGQAARCVKAVYQVVSRYRERSSLGFLLRSWLEGEWQAWRDKRQTPPVLRPLRGEVPAREWNLIMRAYQNLEKEIGPIQTMAAFGEVVARISQIYLL